MKKMIILAALLLAISLRAGDLTVDNLTVSSNTAVYGKLDFYSIASSTNTNGVAATGGTITTNGNYRIHTFTNNGTFDPNGSVITCQVLVVAGGGAGGHSTGGGGGGGGVVHSNSITVTGERAVVVGARGLGNSIVEGTGGSGSNSSFEGMTTAVGGGGGGSYRAGVTGGSGGGGGTWPSPGWSGGSGTDGQGYAGGDGVRENNVGEGPGGGGGAGEVGEDGTTTTAGVGGEGISYNISGESEVYGSGGGAGGSISWGASPTGGLGGTGAGNGGNRNPDVAPGSGTYYGCGGGGGPNAEKFAGGNGYQGVVIVSYLINQTGSSSTNVTTLTVSSNGISQTSASGSNVFMSKVGIGTDNPAEKLHVVGNARVDGSMTLGNETRTNWPNVAVGALIASNNLSDVSDPATARANLGLGSAATNDAGVFMTPTSDGSQLTNITAAQVGALSTNAGALLSANNLSDVANAGTARDNLGLGSAATNEASAFLTPTGSGAQLTDITAAQVGALSTNGGVVNGTVSLVSPAGDVPMGVYTNQ